MAAVGNIKTEPGSCDLCGGDSSTNYCKQCHQYICDRCKDIHNKVNKGHTLMVVTDIHHNEVLADNMQFSGKLSAIVSQFGQVVVKMKEKMKTCEEEKVKYIFNRKDIHQRVRQQAQQIKVLTDARCEELIKETDALMKDKLSQLEQYTNTVSSQHRIAEEMYSEAINLQHSMNVESDQVELLGKKLSEMEQTNADPRLRDPLRIIYNDSTPKVEDIRTLMGTLQRYDGEESDRTTDEPPAKRNRSIIEKWGSSWTKRTAEKVSEFQLKHCKTFKDCSYTSIAQSSTGDIFTLDSAHGIEWYSAKGEFLKPFNPNWGCRFSKLAIVNTRLFVSYIMDYNMAAIEISLPQFSHKELNVFKKRFPGHILFASCGNVAAALAKIHETKRERKRNEFKCWTWTYVHDKYLEIKYFTEDYFSHGFFLQCDKVNWMQDEAPSDMAVDKEKNLFLLFPDHHYLVGVNSGGKEKFIYGTENIPGTGVGQLTHPSCVCTDNNGDIYIGDTGRIVKIKPDGTFIYHITGVWQPMSGYVFMVDHQGQIVSVDDGKVIKYIY